uniref:ZP domain-containing protein n=1 Tax=Angiostrongylus cantonensis TaxID=6313 RepID=A0A0K0CXF3_ANGCA
MNVVKRMLGSKMNVIISELSAMCSSEGITASILFNRPFSGRIYSLNYATVHECVYYNGNGLESILFSIPAHRCGTRLSRTTRNMVDQMENQVYVQIEKDAQTTADRQFLFVCQLADGYPVPPEMNKTPSPYRMWTYPEPVKSNTVPRVAAFSSDGHLGNWPIPGARPYAPNVTPVSSWPRQPLPEPIIPQSTPARYSPERTIARSFPTIDTCGPEFCKYLSFIKVIFRHIPCHQKE